MICDTSLIIAAAAFFSALLAYVIIHITKNDAWDGVGYFVTAVILTAIGVGLFFGLAWVIGAVFNVCGG